MAQYSWLGQQQSWKGINRWQCKSFRDTQEQRQAKVGPKLTLTWKLSFAIKPSSGNLSSIGPDAYAGLKTYGMVLVQSWIDHSHQNFEWGKFLWPERKKTKQQRYWRPHVIYGRGSTKSELQQSLEYVEQLQSNERFAWFNQVGAFANVDASAIREHNTFSCRYCNDDWANKNAIRSAWKKTALFANNNFMQNIETYNILE